MRERHSTEALTIGQLATLTKISAKTIRYYEEIGLLPEPPRGANSYRRYGAADINRLHLPRTHNRLALIRTSWSPPNF